MVNAASLAGGHLARRSFPARQSQRAPACRTARLCQRGAAIASTWVDAEVVGHDVNYQPHPPH